MLSRLKINELWVGWTIENLFFFVHFECGFSFTGIDIWTGKKCSLYHIRLSLCISNDKFFGCVNTFRSNDCGFFIAFVLWKKKIRKKTRKKLLNRICFTLGEVSMKKKSTLRNGSEWNGLLNIVLFKDERGKEKRKKRKKLTRMVFICSFLMVFERPKNFFFVHWKTYQSDFGAGIILNGGGHVPPFSK